MLRGSSVERDGTPLSASSLVLDWYLMLRRERERERGRELAESFFQFVHCHGQVSTSSCPSSGTARMQVLVATA